MSRKLNKVLEHQKKSKNLKEDELNDEVIQGVEERLNKVTKNNLKLKKTIEELNNVIVNKNGHIARLLTEIKFLKENQDQKDEQLKEIQKILQAKDSQIKEIEDRQYFDPEKLKLQLEDQKVVK